MTEKERLLFFIRSLGIGQNKFEKSVGWGSGYIAHHPNDQKIGTKHKIMLSMKYPQLSLNWLETGNGEMIDNESIKTPIIAEPEEECKRTCPFCKEKDRLIESLLEQIKSKDEIISLLKNQ